MQKIQKFFIASFIFYGCFVQAKDQKKTPRNHIQDFAVGLTIGGTSKAISRAVNHQQFIETRREWSPPRGEKLAHTLQLECARDISTLTDFGIKELGRHCYRKAVGRDSVSTLLGCIIGEAVIHNIRTDKNGKVYFERKISISSWVVELLRRWFKN